jgi:hypothetical protein
VINFRKKYLRRCGMQSFILKLIGLIFVPVILCSCATTSLVDTWRNPDMTILKHRKLLLVYISKNDTTSRLYEDVLASELSRRGVASVTGYAILPEGKKVNRQNLAKGVEQSGADAVITMQTVRVEQRTTIQPGYEEIYPDYWYPGAFPRWDMYGYFDGYSYYEPPLISTSEIAKIQVNLFDAQKSKLLWAATVQTSEPGNAVSVSKELAGIVVSSLIKEGLI